MDLDSPQPTTESTLPAVVLPDWNQARDRYLQGEDLATIALDCNTTVNAISIRAHREKWKDQQIKELLRDEKALSSEIRGNLIVSCLRESRMFQQLGPAANAETLDLMSRVRQRLYETTAKLLHWDADPLDAAKRVKTVIDV